MPVCHLCVFSGKMFVGVFYPFFLIGSFVFFFGTELYELLVHLSNPLLVMPFANSTFHSAVFFVDDFCAKAFMCNLVSFVCVFLNYCLFCLL